MCQGQITFQMTNHSSFESFDVLGPHPNVRNIHTIYENKSNKRKDNKASTETRHIFCHQWDCREI